MSTLAALTTLVQAIVVSVLLIACGGSGSPSDTGPPPDPPPVTTPPASAAFFAEYAQPIAPVEVQFRNDSANATEFHWDFGDGTSSTERSPRHVYDTLGIYYVTLTARNSAGQRSITQELLLTQPGTYSRSVLLALDPDIVRGVSLNLNQFMRDLRADGYNVLVYKVSSGSAASIREAIRAQFTSATPRLEGVIFFGNIPVPVATYEYPNPPGTFYSAPSMQFFMDLDGEFSYRGGAVTTQIDSHTGATEIEIWASILPAYGTLNQTIARINAYLEKNHRYRTAGLGVQRGFVQPVLGSRITTVDLYNYQYSVILNEYFVALNRRGNFFVGIDNKLGDLDRFPTSAVSYEREMLTDKYDIASIGAHGNAVSFGSFNEWGSIVIDLAYARSRPIKTVFLLEHSCNTADISVQPNLASEFLYNAANNVLAFAGASGPQGGMGDTTMGRASNYTAELLATGQSIGSSYFGPMRLPYTGIFRNYRDAFAAQQILLGDGTLRLQEFMVRN
jgi:PKD repeat protein